MRLATVLYEDKMQAGSGGAFPPHDLVLAMVSDLIAKLSADEKTKSLAEIDRKLAALKK